MENFRKLGILQKRCFTSASNHNQGYKKYCRPSYIVSFELNTKFCRGDKSWARFLQSCSRLRSLKVFIDYDFSNFRLFKAFKFLNSLKQLDLHLPDRRNIGWQEELSSFISHPGLEKVRLGSRSDSYAKFHPSILNQIAQKCKRLKELAIDSCYYTEETKGSLGQIKTLNSLEFNWKHYFKPFQVKQLLKDLLQNLALETLTFEVRNPDVRNSLEPVIPKILTMTKLRYLRIFDFETEFEIERDPRILECLENYPQYDPTSSITKCFISYPFGYDWLIFINWGESINLTIS